MERTFDINLVRILSFTVRMKVPGRDWFRIAVVPCNVPLPPGESAEGKVQVEITAAMSGINDSKVLTFDSVGPTLQYGKMAPWMIEELVHHILGLPVQAEIGEAVPGTRKVRVEEQA
jgi:hypothetical protein